MDQRDRLERIRLRAAILAADDPDVRNPYATGTEEYKSFDLGVEDHEIRVAVARLSFVAGGDSA